MAVGDESQRERSFGFAALGGRLVPQTVELGSASAPAFLFLLALLVQAPGQTGE